MVEDATGLLVFLEAAAGEVAADDGFDRKGLELTHEHRARDQVFVAVQGLGQRVGVVGHEVRREDEAGLIKPPKADLGEEDAFARDAVGHHDVEGRETVSRDNQIMRAEVEDFTDLALRLERVG